MADVDDGNAALVAQALDVGQDLGLARIIERGKRFIHEQEARIGEQRPPDGNPLLLTAREAPRSPFENGCDAEQVDHPIEVVAASARGCEPAAIEEVLSHGQVGKEASFLEYVAEAAPVARHRDAAPGVDEHDASTIASPRSGRIRPAQDPVRA